VTIARGPTFVVLTQDSRWTYGLLANQLWSFAGSSDRSEISALSGFGFRFAATLLFPK
jgi:hypothetical protein